ncbi:MAG: tandem-95 repeat protein [Candidatus Thermoplasmatota archaeon]|nr:tandem-95 repeat protein [Candidatus Thermoplasmatota archaeon]
MRKKIMGSNNASLNILFLTIFSCLMIATPFHSLDLFSTSTVEPMSAPAWPDTWIQFDVDPNENGWNDNYRDVHYAYYNLIDGYIFFRLECWGYPVLNLVDTARYKWFIDLDLPYDMHGQGGNVIDAEYLFFVEDSPFFGGDGDGEIYLLEDLNDDGGIDNADYPDYLTDPGEITDTSLAGYRISGHYIDLYLNESLISNPDQIYFTWATDQQNNNLDQAPKTDRSDDYWDASLLRADVTVQKTASPDPVTAGSTMTYTLTVKNNGPDIAEGINVTDSLPSELTFISATPTPTGQNGQTLWWHIASLIPGDSTTITINAQVDSSFEGTLSNTVNALNTTYDPLPGNNAHTLTTVVESGTNDPPVAVDDSGSCDEDSGGVWIDVLGNDYDDDGSLDVGSVLVVSGPSSGSVSVNTSTGEVEYVPVGDFCGSDSFVYEVSDDEGAVASATVSISVFCVNDPPVAVDDSGSCDEDSGGVWIDVLGNDYDPDVGDVLSVDSVGSPGHGSVVLSGDGVEYTPAAGFCGDDSFSYTVVDGNGGSDSAMVFVEVFCVNDPPTADAGGPYTGFVGDMVTFDGSGSSDVDGTISSYEWFVDGVSVFSGDVSFFDLYLIGYDIGEYEIKLIVLDNEGMSDEDITSLNVENMPPIANAGGPYFGGFHDDITLDGSGSSDVDGEIVLYEWDLDNDGFFDDATGVNPVVSVDYYWSSIGTFPIKLRVTDDCDATDLDATTIDISNLVADANGPYDGCRVEVVLLDGSHSFDSDGTIENYEWLVGDVSVYSGSSSTYDLDLSNYGLGTYVVQLTVTDDEGNTDEDYTELIVANCPPVADAGGDYFIPEDRGYSVDFDGTGSYDLDGEIVSYEWDFGDGHTGSGAEPTHKYGQSGSYVATLTVIDNDGATDTDTATVHITGADPPIIQLITPKDGDRLSGTVRIYWYAIDDDYPGGEGIPIYLYYSMNDGGSWQRLCDVQTNNVDIEHGDYSWDTHDFADGTYVLKAEAMDREGNIDYDTSYIEIVNGDADVKISDINFENMDTDQYTKWLKTGDDVKILAGITGYNAPQLTVDEITADLSDFGMGHSVKPDVYDGFIASWTILDASPVVENGLVEIIISADETQRTGAIQIDNIAPEASFIKPNGGLYMHNARVLPMKETFIVGAIDVSIDVFDEGRIDHVDYYLDSVKLASVDADSFGWRCDVKSWNGNYVLEAHVFDAAGNKKVLTQDVIIFNPNGKDW